MANLKDIANRHNIDITFRQRDVAPPTKPENDQDKIAGKIRRPWLVEDYENPTPQTESKHGLNPVSTESINPVLTPLKPGFNRVDKQGLKFEHAPGLNKIKDLRGNPLKVIKCLIAAISEDEPYVTEKLSTTDIGNRAKITKESVKTTLKNLKKFGLINCLDSYTGVHGWSIYKLKKEIVHDFMKQGLNPVETGSISSSNIIIKTTTKDKGASENTSFSNDWEDIDITPLAEIGFSKHYLMQIAKKSELSAAIVQDSINAFAFDLKINGKKFDTNPINYFMGIVCKGNPYMPPHNYESEKSRAMRMFLERKREWAQKDAALEEELLNESFNDWKNSLSEKELNDLLPDEIKDSRLTGAKTAALRSYYKKEFWASKRQEIIKG